MSILVRRLLFAFLLAGSCFAQSDLSELNLEQLGQVKVTSASRKSENLSTAAAAIYVLSGEAILNGGFRNLPDALRTVPGLYGAQTDAHIWQISARGFSDLYNNKMLVLVDGRSVYTPLYGGVYWDTLDIPVENIARVEIIRGPGGTLWGANAVNGVINIVTKQASDAQGTLVSATINKDEGYTTTVRQGGMLGSKLGYYAYGRASYWEPLRAPSGAPIPNRLMLPQAGLRLDWELNEKNLITVEGGAYDGRIRSTQFLSLTPSTTVLKGNNVLVRWKHEFSTRASTDTFAYCDWYSRFSLPPDSRNTCDVEFQHNFEWNPRNSLVWGGAFSTTGDNLAANSEMFTRLRRRNSVESAFVQYGLALIPDRLRLIAGTKIEHNGYTGAEYQPQIRAVWTPRQQHAFWASVSRAVRVPSRGESDLDMHTVVPNVGPGGLPVLLDIYGSNELEAEHLHAYEAGYRYQANSFTFDVATYYNDYNNRIVQRQTMAMLPSGLLLDYNYMNGGSAQSHGAEVSVQWRPIERWTLAGGVTEARGSPDALQATPRHLFNLQSRFLATSKLQIETSLYHYSTVPLGRLAEYPTVPLQAVPSFDRWDCGGMWHFLPQWTFGVWGRNLQSPRHLETRNTIFGNVAGQVPRSVEFRLIWEHGGEGRRKK
jgi:iron complex outermembrane receptor protein